MLQKIMKAGVEVTAMSGPCQSLPRTACSAFPRPKQARRARLGIPFWEGESASFLRLGRVLELSVASMIIRAV